MTDKTTRELEANVLNLIMLPKNFENFKGLDFDFLLAIYDRLDGEDEALEIFASAMKELGVPIRDVYQALQEYEGGFDLCRIFDFVETVKFKNAGKVRYYHDLKTIQPYFDQVVLRQKTFELRRDDRGFKVGEYLALREWNKHPNIKYTDSVCYAKITSILKDAPGFGLKPGYVVMSIEREPVRILLETEEYGLVKIPAIHPILEQVLNLSGVVIGESISLKTQDGFLPIVTIDLEGDSVKAVFIYPKQNHDVKYIEIINGKEKGYSSSGNP